MSRYHNFNIIKFRGDRKEARIRLPNGNEYDVERVDRMYVEHYGMVTCAPYQEHFIFQQKDTRVIGASLLCTCGSPAVIIGPKQYARTRHQASPQGYMLCCQSEYETGKHAE